jgi:hypothetical protein
VSIIIHGEALLLGPLRSDHAATDRGHRSSDRDGDHHPKQSAAARASIRALTRYFNADHSRVSKEAKLAWKILEREVL